MVNKKNRPKLTKKLARLKEYSHADLFQLQGLFSIFFGHVLLLEHLLYTPRQYSCSSQFMLSCFINFFCQYCRYFPQKMKLPFFE